MRFTVFVVALLVSTGVMAASYCPPGTGLDPLHRCVCTTGELTRFDLLRYGGGRNKLCYGLPFDVPTPTAVSPDHPGALAGGFSNNGGNGAPGGNGGGLGGAGGGGGCPGCGVNPTGGGGGGGGGSGGGGGGGGCVAHGGSGNCGVGLGLGGGNGTGNEGNGQGPPGGPKKGPGGHPSH
jgi:hypothetical protein